MLPQKIAHGRYAEALEQIRRGTGLGDRTSRGKGPLHLAAEHDRPELITALIAAGAHPDGADTAFAFQPLRLAAELGHTSSACALLDGGASHLCTSDLHPTPLHLFAEAGRCRAVRRLIQAGAPVDATPTTSSATGPTPLTCAARAGQVETVRFLLDAGADPLGPGGHYGFPLFAACVGKSPPCVELILEAVPAAPANLSDAIGYAVDSLCDAARISRDSLGEWHAIIALLVSAGADLNQSRPLQGPTHRDRLRAVLSAQEMIELIGLSRQDA